MPNKKLDNDFSVDKFIREIFFDTLTDKDKFDIDIVHLIKKHLGENKVHSRAGKNLANDLILLGKKRSQEEEK